MTNTQRLIKLAEQGKFPVSSLVKAAYFKASLEKLAANNDIWRAIITALAVGGGFAAINHIADASSEAYFQGQKPKLLQAVYEVHPELKQEDPVLVERYFNSLAHFSPEVAKDPFAAGGFIYQALRTADLGGPPLTSYKDLAGISKDLVTTRQARPAMSKTMVTPIQNSLSALADASLKNNILPNKQ